MDNKVYTQTKDGNMSVSEWLEHWIAEYGANAVSRDTLRHYKHYFNYYVIPTLGDIPLCKLTTQDVQTLCDKLLTSGRIHKDAREDKESGLSWSMVRTIRVAFGRVMKDAVNAGLIEQNPVSGSVLPKIDNHKQPIKTLDEEQLEKFIKTISREPFWYNFFYTEISTGLRRGEICALAWNDFNEESGELNICRSINRGDVGHQIIEYGTGSEKRREGRGQNAREKRTIILPASTVTRLIAHKALQNPQSKWIFPSSKDPANPISPNTVRMHLKRVLNGADLPEINFQDMRHTFATHALTNGVDPKTLASMLGHVNASFTADTYDYVTKDTQYKAAGIVGDFMDGITGNRNEAQKRDEKLGTASIQQLKAFLECEIEIALERLKDESNPCYDGVLVGKNEAHTLQEKHIKFCRHLLSLMIDDK